MKTNINILPEYYSKLNESEIDQKISEAKKKLKDKLLVLGHHYQVDDVIKFADITGDSLALSQKAANTKDAQYIVFCGVHFMAESADILTSNSQKVMLPDLSAGCSMADMADIEDLEEAWEELSQTTKDKIIPITYINSAANIKAFCGNNNGIVCTSSNADKILKWALSKGNKVLFLPDKNLGKNTAYKEGIKLEEMIPWKPEEELGGNTIKDIKNSKVILWEGYCSVHEMFKPIHIKNWKEKYSDVNILVHPECSFEVVANSDFVGSTSYIINTIKSAEKGTKWAIGTEVNLVNRLKNEHPELMINSLSPYQCLCATMYRIRPPYLLNVLDNLIEGKVINQITVPEDIAEASKISLDRMLSMS